jgi:hypothetical protein
MPDNQVEPAKPDRFARIVASIDTPGGQALLYLLAMLIAVGVGQLNINEFGRALIYIFEGAMINSLRGKGAENHNFESPQVGPRIPAAPLEGGSRTETTTTLVSSTENKDKK